MFTKLIAAAFLAAGLVAGTMVFGSTRSKVAEPCCACCVDCTCTNCVCDELGCACEAGGPCFCEDSCSASCCN